MTVADLITRLQQQHPNAQIKFYDHNKDIFLNMNTVDAGKLCGAEVMIIGEADIHTKKALATMPKTSGNPFQDFLDSMKK